MTIASRFGAEGFARRPTTAFSSALLSSTPTRPAAHRVRAGFETSIVEGVTIEGGLSGLDGTGFHRGSPSTKDVLVWRDTNEDGVVQSTEVQSIPGTPLTPSQNFHRFAIGADLRLRVKIHSVGELSLRGELVRASNLDRGSRPADPIATARNLREFGWYAGLTQELFRYGVVGFRYDSYDPDADATNQRGLYLVPWCPRVCQTFKPLVFPRFAHSFPFRGIFRQGPMTWSCVPSMPMGTRAQLRFAH